MKRLAVAAACFVAGLGLVGTAWAAPAPPGDSSGSAVSIGDFHISKTSAHADKDGSKGTAHPFDVGPIKFGGESTNSGAILETPDNSPVYAALAPWAASASKDDNSRTAEGTAAVLRIEAGEFGLDVLESESKATHTDAKSSGSGSSNGVELNAPIGHVQVLHSEVSEEGKGSSHLLGIGDVKLGTQNDLGKICSLDLQVVGIACLQAKGGEGSASATVADVGGDVLGPLNPIKLIDQHGTSGVGVADDRTAAVTPAPTPTPAPVPDAIATSSTTEKAGPKNLASTGFAWSLMALAGLLLVAIGGLLRRTVQNY